MNSLLKTLKYARTYWFYLVIAGISLLFITGLNLTAPWLIRELIAIITLQQPVQEAFTAIRNLFIILGIVYLLRMFFTFLYRYLSHLAAWNLVADMRIRVYNHLQSLSLKYYHDKQTGQLMSRTINDPATLELLIAHAVPDLAINILILIGVAIILFVLNPFLAIFTLIPIPLMITASLLFGKRMLPNFQKAQKTLGELNAIAQDNLSGMREIHAFNQQQHESTKIEKSAKTYAGAIIDALRISAVFHPSIEFLSSLGTVIVVGLGGMMALQGRMPVQDVVGFLLYLGMFYQPIGALARVIEDVQMALAGAQRVFEVLEEQPDVKENEHAAMLKTAKGNVKFEDVSFKYTENNEVLKNVSFEVKAGEMVALVGPTGVGKTTLISLIPRFYDPISGVIKIDDVDIKDLTLFSLRNQISMVLQDVFLFNGTIADNIAYGSRNPSKEQVVAAAKTANAHEFIDVLPQGYDTYIGERGIKLSGGQKQRISIARAVLRNTPILILDEATASVDVETEQKIQQAIGNLIHNKTIIVIAHRLSTVKNANNIIVLEDGMIVEQGTHQQLLARNGLYHRLCKVQFTESSVELI